MSHAARDLAVRCVADACRVARQVQQDLDAVRAIVKSDQSPVTVADYAVQAAVNLALMADDPNVRVVGEERADELREPENRAVLDAVVKAVRSVQPGATDTAVLTAIDRGDHDGSGDHYWTLDPVDGTKGFLRGQQYAVALALLDGDGPIVGALGCPNLPQDHDAALDVADASGTMYAAIRGRGAQEYAAGAADAAPRAIHAAGTAGAGDGRPNPLGTTGVPDPLGGDGGSGGGSGVLSTAATLKSIRVCESVESGHSDQSASARILKQLGADANPVRLDSQCKYAVVARGQADAYLRLPTRPGYVEKIWDHAAGMLVATEAGATVSDVTGQALDFSHGKRLERNRGVICARADVHERLIAAIRDLGLDQPLTG
ncbi:MAG: inositol monophosphatase family protein [Phycisphaerales bacterium]